MRRNKGFTLLELVMAISLGSGLLMATTMFFAPSVSHFQATTHSNALRLQVLHPLESIGNDVEASRSLYVDNTLCYATCMVDIAGQNRTYYYWGTGEERGTLYRKKESVVTPISCTGGKVIAQNLDRDNSNFTIQKDMINVELSAPGLNGSLFRTNSSFFPTIQERDTILSEGFECKTLKDGWVVTLGSGRSSWSVVASTQNLGSYEISDSDVSSGTDTTSIEMAIDISRISSAHLSFRYMNRGTITSSDSFEAFLYDGTDWQLIFSDASHLPVAYSKPVQVDLTPYSLNTNNKIRFTSTLSVAGAHWYVDQIQVYTP